MQEIIESIDYCLACNNDSIPTTQEDLQTIKEALEKQIPKKLKPRGEFDPSGQCKLFCCPRCNKWQYTKVDGRIVTGIMSAYCPSCGQALDWNDLKGETK